METEFSIFKAYASSYNSNGVIIKAPTAELAQKIATQAYEGAGHEIYEIEPTDEDFEEYCDYFSHYNIRVGYYVGGYIPVDYLTRKDYIDEILEDL